MWGDHARKRGCSEKKIETEVSEQGTTASGVAQDSRPVSIPIISQPKQFVKDFHRTEDDVVAEFNACGSTQGIVDLVGCAYLGEDYIAIVKMNVKEYANNDAKLYDNRVVTIEELTVVGRDGHLIEETKRGSTSPTVSSKHILSQYRDFVNRKYSISEDNFRSICQE